MSLLIETDVVFRSVNLTVLPGHTLLRGEGNDKRLVCSTRDESLDGSSTPSLPNTSHPYLCLPPLRED